ncbi:reverse transcriptase domain-containing protein [Tanacetum coccineum]|uniref:Reverse transcriptase domain-containing protein n=1 Tax=Tanacetum coccineum TaxID=301880 RepID=A0ABQ5HJZ2_9ASTR
MLASSHYRNVSKQTTRYEIQTDMSVRGTVAVRGGRTRQYEVLFRWRLDQSACDTWHSARVSTRHRRGNRRVPFYQRNNPPKNPRIVYPPILDINHFRHFLVTLENLYPMDDEPMWAAEHVVAPTPGSAITIPKTANEFAIKGNHLTFVKGNQFDGRTKTDPHKHIHEFLRICDMFKYRDTKNEVVRLIMFPLSLTGEAKTWLDELNEGTIETWDELQTAFISRFFPLALFDRLLGEI